MVTCPQCGSEQPDGTAFCDNCGYALGKGGAQPRLGDQNASQDGAPTVVASNNCPSCGASVPPGEDFCPNCGGQLVGNTGQSAGSMPEPRIPQQQPEPRPSGSQAGHMLTCPSCGAQLAPDSIFCDMCGARLDAADQSQSGSSQPSEQEQWQQPQPRPEEKSSWQEQQQGRGQQQAWQQQQVQAQGQQQSWQQQQQPQPRPQPVPVGGGMQARLVVQGTNVTLPFPPGKNEVILGREDPVSGIFPDIDLTDHGGDEGGVSRQHARIYTQSGQFYIEDLKSVNYTFVNQQKVLPEQPQALNNGDEIRLGRVKLTFQRI